MVHRITLRCNDQEYDKLLELRDMVRSEKQQLNDEEFSRLMELTDALYGVLANTNPQLEHMSSMMETIFGDRANLTTGEKVCCGEDCHA
jgi:hypothetical protein